MKLVHPAVRALQFLQIVGRQSPSDRFDPVGEPQFADDGDSLPTRTTPDEGDDVVAELFGDNLRDGHPPVAGTATHHLLHDDDIRQAPAELLLEARDNICLVEIGEVDPALVAREKANTLKSGGLLEIVGRVEKPEQIGGLVEIKGWLAKHRDAFGQAARDYGLPSPKGLLIIGIPGTGKSLTAKATASVFGLPPEFLRKGRFDELFFVDLPDQKERVAIWEIVIKKYGGNPGDYDTVRLAKATETFTGATPSSVGWSTVVLNSIPVAGRGNGLACRGAASSVLEGVAFPPMGDVTLPEAFALVDDRFLITGGISAIQFETLQTREAVFEYVRGLFSGLAAYRHRFMLAASCNTPTNARWEQIVWFRDAWHEYCRIQ